MATEITKLQLPSLVIPGLFLAQKIACNKHGRQSCESLVNSASANNLGPPPGLPPPSTSSTEEIEPPSTSSTPPPPPPYPRSAESVSTADSEQANTKTESSPKIINSVTRPTSPQRVVLGHVSGPVSYRSAVQSGYNQSATESQMNAASRSTLSKGAVTKQRRINPNIVRCVGSGDFLLTNGADFIYSLSVNMIHRLAHCSTSQRMVVSMVQIVDLDMIISWIRMTMRL